jgi:hypothetical protein
MPVRKAYISRQGFGGPGRPVSVSVPDGVSGGDADRMLAAQNGVDVSDLSQNRWDFLDSCFGQSGSVGTSIGDAVSGFFNLIVLIFLGAIVLNVMSSNNTNQNDQSSTTIEYVRNA